LTSVSAVIRSAALKQRCNRGCTDCPHSFTTTSPRNRVMSKTFDPYDETRDDDLFAADDLDTSPWSLDELERSADLGSVRSACAGCGDAHDF
jgi:hypothetical protein